MHFTIIIVIAFVVWMLSFQISAHLSVLMMRTNIVDHPDNDRKTQSEPIPRLGGVAIFGALTIGFILLLLQKLISPSLTQSRSGLEMADIAAMFASEAPLYLSFSAFAFVLGLWDDIWTANTKLKLALLAAASLGAAWLGLHPDALTTPFGNVTTPAALILGSALWLLVFTNAANFMDGSNGLSIGCMAIMLAGLAIAGTQSGDFSFSLWWFALLGAIAGFLIHNLLGKLYAGDAGALGLGALFASLGLISGLEVWTVATLALPFLIDVLLTLVWRAKHKRSWLKAHRDHAYQRLIDTGWSHLDVAFLYWGMTIAAAVAAVIAAKAGGAAPFAVFWALTLIGTVLWCLNRSEIRLQSEA